jgi:hypothetical protein
MIVTLGKIKQKTSTTREVTLPKTIKEANPTCGCTVPTVQDNKINFVYNSPQLNPDETERDISKKIRIVYQDDTTDVIEIKATICL